MGKQCIFIFSILFFFTAKSEAENNPGHLLKKYSDSLRFCKIDSLRSSYNDSFKSLLKGLLQEEHPFNLDLDSIKNTVSVLSSDDGKLKVISWVYINDKEQYFNHCVVLYRRNSSHSENVYWLNDRIELNSDSLYEDYTKDFWPGALYYQMFQFKKRGKDYYCMLGMNGRSSFSNRKIIDVLWVDKLGELHIGAPVFYSSENDFTPQYRVFFEFADQSTMILRFEKELKMITFSNLVPSNPERRGQWQYYIPDGRIDYYQLKKRGRWIRYEGLAEFDMIGNP